MNIIKRIYDRLFICKPESVLFLTMHKAGSVLMGNTLLQNMVGLEHCDYTAKVFLGEEIKKIEFHKKGYVYGPIRINLANSSDEYTKVVELVCNQGFLKTRKVIFMVRDPRDILVSSYFSFAYSHKARPGEEESFEKMRNVIKETKIDEYVLENASALNSRFEIMHNLISYTASHIVIRYEDMINEYEKFINKISEIVSLNPEVIEKLKMESRPLDKENIMNHKRSGKPGGYKNHLKCETINSLNQILKDSILLFEY